MPIYEYVCTNCGNRTDILHGVHAEGPSFCPACGAEGSMRKAFAPPAIVFKGSGWAKKERRAAARSSAKAAEADGGTAAAGKDGSPSDGDAKTTPKPDATSGGSAKSDSGTPAASG